MSDFLHGVEVVEVSTGARTIKAASSSVIGVVGTAPFADADLFPYDTPVLVTTPAQMAGLLATYNPQADADDPVGTLYGALADIYDQAQPPIIVVRVEDGANEAATQAEVTGSLAASTGVYALLTAKGRKLPVPRILVAAGHTHQVPKAGEPAVDVVNPVVAALKIVADKLRAVVVVDGPNDTNAAALAKHGREKGQRVYFVENFVKVADAVTGQIVDRPASARVAGVIAMTDRAKGFWWSPSNQPVAGVLGTERLIDFSLSDPTSAVNVLNAAGVATIVNEDGFRVWGNRTGAADQDWDFLSVRRTADMIHASVERSYLWALDRPQSGQLVEDVIGGVEAYLRDLKARGAILRGRAWLDPDLNTETSLKAGQVFVNFDFEPPPPMERLTFRSHRNAAYFSELVKLTAPQA